MKLWTTFTFEASHTLTIGEPMLHGHSYWVQVFVKTSARAPANLAAVQQECGRFRAALDHRHLNDQFSEPTMEAIAEWIGDTWREGVCKKVIVRRDSLAIGVEYRL